LKLLEPIHAPTLLAHERLGDDVGTRDLGQLGVEHAGEGEQAGINETSGFDS